MRAVIESLWTGGSRDHLTSCLRPLNNWFTGMHGQTPGKMVLGLHVVTHRGERPGWGSAALRATVGALGIGLAGIGMLPLFFDPARRALHDRLLRTRVVKV